MIHPGYGFLSENAAFARACAREGITFVGPSPDLLENMGDKTAARALAHKFKVPTLPGTEDPITDPDQALKVAHDIGFPLIIKAAFGGGGRGMRVVEKPSQLAELVSRGAERGAQRLRQLRGFPGALHFPRQAHRGADPRRPARQRRPPLRTRLLGAAAPSESGRGRPGDASQPDRSARNSATPPSRSPRASAMTTRAPSSSSTTWTRTTGSSSR